MSMVRFVAGQKVVWVDPSVIRDVTLVVQANEEVQMTAAWRENNSDTGYWVFPNADQAIAAVQALQLPYDPSDFCRQPEAEPRPANRMPRGPRATIRRVEVAEPPHMPSTLGPDFFQGIERSVLSGITGQSALSALATEDGDGVPF